MRRLFGGGLVGAHHGDEEVGDAGGAHLAERGEPVAVDAVEQQDAAAEHLALVDRLQRPGGVRACSGATITSA